jgi:hypothetical protein
MGNLSYTDSTVYDIIYNKYPLSNFSLIDYTSTSLFL